MGSLYVRLKAKGLFKGSYVAQSSSFERSGQTSRGLALKALNSIFLKTTPVKIGVAQVSYLRGVEDTGESKELWSVI